MDSCPVGCPAGSAARAGGCSHPVCDRAGEAPRGDRGGGEWVGRVGAGAAEPVRSARSGTGTGSHRPPFGHDGTERRIGRPQDPTEQTHYYSGKKKCHTVKNVLLINAVLTILFLSETYEGSTPINALPIPPRTPCRRGAGGSRISASSRSRPTRATSSCRPGSPQDGSSNPR